jgi:hypothetical protein
MNIMNIRYKFHKKDENNFNEVCKFFTFLTFSLLGNFVGKFSGENFEKKREFSWVNGKKMFSGEKFIIKIINTTIILIK